jgi:MoxR-like ATPase
LRELVELCRYKKNIIIQGPPGVGKTFAASRLAHLLIGSTNEEQIQRVQFHPSYSYEDFVQGLRPVEGGGFVRKDGPLLSFCKDALEDQASPYVLIIDEINRGNVSKILGELLSLIEADKRDPRYGVTLAYARDDEPRFHVPPNLFVIGMMNTADRSLAFVDYALRRRFVFVDLEPAFGTDRFEADLTRRGVEASLRKTIQERLTALNARIASDPTLGPGFRVGHSYFCQRVDAYDEGWLRRIVEYEIVPLLREYWFDSPAKLDEALVELRGG